MEKHNYAIIHNFVLELDLSALQIKLYALLTQLSNKYDYSFASNEYLANKLKTTKTVISQNLSKLVKMNCIDIQYQDPKDKTKRIIRPIQNYKEYNNLCNGNKNIAINEQKQSINQQSEVNQYKDAPQQTKTLKTQKNQPKKPKQIIQTQELNTIDDDEPNLPFFIDIEVWHKYLRYKSERREIIGAMQKEQLFQTLAKMHEQGIDVNQAILNSIANGYKGIFGEKQKVDINSQDYAMQKTREACERLAKIYEAKEKAEREANVSRETNKGATNGF